MWLRCDSVSEINIEILVACEYLDKNDVVDSVLEINMEVNQAKLCNIDSDRDRLFWSAEWTDSFLIRDKAPTPRQQTINYLSVGGSVYYL